MELKFLTHHNLQGSQTAVWRNIFHAMFLTHHNLQGSQTWRINSNGLPSFLTHHNLQMVLKLMFGGEKMEASFLPIIIYKGSQTVFMFLVKNHGFLTHHNLQGSQTYLLPPYLSVGFLTHHNLQGSQTGRMPVVEEKVSYPS